MLLLHRAQARFYLAHYPADGIPEAQASYPSEVLPGLENGLIAVSPRSTHLGVRIRYCTTSGWFEDPAHGSKWNRVGEKTGGPAPRGLDQYPVRVTAGTVFVDLGTLVRGVPIGVHTIESGPDGPM